MGNPKVFEFAKEIGMTPLALMDKIREWHLPVKSHMAELEPEVLEQIKVRLSGKSSTSETFKPKKATVRKVPSSLKKQTSATETDGSSTSKVTVVRRKAKEGDDIDINKVKSTPPTSDELSQEQVVGDKPTLIKKKAVQSVSSDIDRPISSSSSLDETSVKNESTSDQKVESIYQPEKDTLKEINAKDKDKTKQIQISHQTKNETGEFLNPEIENSQSVSASKLKISDVTESGAKVVLTGPTPSVVEEVKIPSRKKEVTVGTSGVSSSSTPAAGVGRKNIIGRMDLSRVSQPQSQRQPQRPYGQSGGGSSDRASGGVNRPGGFSSPSRSGAGNRNIRTGFVAQVIPPLDIPGVEDNEESRRAKDFDKRAKKLTSGSGASGAKGERETEEVQEFNAVEFRKREMVFQPKKKKGLLSRDALRTQITTPKASKRVIKVNGSMKLSALAVEMGVKMAELTKVLMSNGVMATPGTDLDYDTIALIAPDFGFEAQNIYRTADEIAIETAFGNLDLEPVIRPPVVTVMGHVDHGKTSLLDAIRKTDVAAGEAGGITQHIGAYSVKLEDGSLITFLDTPGHEAFTAMRARGANVTDIAVIVVAADDGMMPQTQEAINHAKAAGVPIIVAVNKIDKPGANVDKIKQQLTELEIVPEEWGGTTIFCEVSALKRTGIKELLEQIKLVAEVQELRANPERSGTGIVIEGKLEKGKGSVASILVKDGTVKVGQYIVAGSVKGRIRSLTNDRGERVSEAGPGLPVEVLGLDDTPNAGDRFDVVKDEVTAEKVSSLRKEQLVQAKAQVGKLSLEEIFSKVQKGDIKELPLVLKADVHGSLEAISGMLAKLNTKEVKIKVIHTAVGGISESDVLLAHTAKGIVLGFNVRPDGGAQSQAKRLGVDIRTYSIVYELIDEMKKAMQGLLVPDLVEKVIGRAEVRNIFSVPKIGTIAGCSVVDGKVQRSSSIRLIRDGKIIYEGKVSSLKRFKDDAKEVGSGFECGIGIENFNDIKVGDVMESFIKEEVARQLTYEAEA